MDKDNLESMIQEKGLTAPRVTPEDIKNNIVNVHYFTAADAVYGTDINTVGFIRTEGKFKPVFQNEEHQSLSLLTFCVLVLKNGFTVTGESACASPENFDAEVGKEIAYQNAISKVWPLMGYALKDTLYKNSL